MHVIATAGHVDHGKSTLLKALTGTDPDRWEEERRRGLTIDLGYAWLDLPSGEQLAFVDVPGHERFVPNMLAGVGPVPAVLLVVAADEGWMPQSAEHLAVVDALGIRRGLLAVTRSDLADPGPALAAAQAALRHTSLAGISAVPVSARTGAGLPQLVAALDELAAQLPPADPGAPVRMWVDRSFSMPGSGTVVTGTLPAGTVHQGDELVITPAMRPVRVRAIQTLGAPADAVTGETRAALNLRGIGRDAVSRGMALIHAGRWTMTDIVDVRLAGPAGPGSEAADRLPRQLTAHVGAARTVARVRPLGGGLLRLTLREPLPLHVGDRLLLRDPGAARQAPAAARRAATAGPLASAEPPHDGPGAAHDGPGAAHDGPGAPHDGPGAPHDGPGAPPGGPGVAAGATPGPSRAGPPSPAALAAIIRPPLPPRPARSEAAACPSILGCVVLDVSPPPLARRGAAAAAARELAQWPDHPAARQLLRRHGLLRASSLLAMGITDHPEPVTGEWLADPEHWAELGRQLSDSVAAHAARQPLAAGMSLEAARAALGLPDRRLVEALAGPPLRVADGMLRVASDGSDVLPEGIAAAVRVLRADLAEAPFRAPDADRLRRLGLDSRAIAAAARAGLLARISDHVVLAPGASEQAAAILATLPQPFTAAQARQALDTTRRIAIPLLEHLDREGVTERLPDDRRRCRPEPGPD